VPDVLRCSFCSKTQNEVRKLIAGPAVYICDECVDVCIEIIEEDTRFQKPAQDATSQEGPEKASRTKRRDGVCSLCGKPSSLDVLPIDDRGVLCGECADAVEDALAQGQPLSEQES
jgi:hypothetical protein